MWSSPHGSRSSKLVQIMKWVSYPSAVVDGSCTSQKSVFILFDLEMAHVPCLPFCTGFILYFVLSQSFLFPSFLRENRHLMLIKILAYKVALRISMLHLCWHYLLISKLLAKSLCQSNIFLCVNMCTSWQITCSFKSFKMFHYKWNNKSKSY